METFSAFRKEALSERLAFSDWDESGSACFWLVFDIKKELLLLKEPATVHRLIMLSVKYGLHHEILTLQTRLCRISYGGPIGWAHGRPYAIPGTDQTITLGEWLAEKGVPFYAE